MRGQPSVSDAVEMSQSTSPNYTAEEGDYEYDDDDDDDDDDVNGKNEANFKMCEKISNS